MTPKQAALIIGCSPTQVTYLLRKKKLKGTKVRLRAGDVGFGRRNFKWDISRAEVDRYAKLDPPGPGARGVSRSKQNTKKKASNNIKGNIRKKK